MGKSRHSLILALFAVLHKKARGCGQKFAHAVKLNAKNANFHETVALVAARNLSS